MPFLKALLIALIAVFAPAKGMVVASMSLVFIDLGVGVWAAKKRQETITSNGLRRTIVKLLVYESALLLAFIAETYLVLDIFPLAKIVSSFIGVAEIKSIFENINDIGGGDLLKALVSKLNGPNE